MYKFLHAAAALLLLAAGLPAPLSAAEGPDKSGFTLFQPTPRELLRELSTDRPDQTESPYTVDAGRFQIEMDFVQHCSHHDTSGGGSVRTKNWSIAPLNLKLGLTKQVDLQLILDSHVGFRMENRGGRNSACKRAS